MGVGCVGRGRIAMLGMSRVGMGVEWWVCEALPVEEGDDRWW